MHLVLTLRQVRAWAPQHPVVQAQGRAKGAPGIAGCGLDPEFIEGTLAKQPAVGHAVEGDTACERKVSHPGLAMHVAGLTEQDLFDDDLNRPRDVHLALRDRTLGLSRRPPEKVVELLRGHAVARQKIEVAEIEKKGAVGCDLD